MSRPPISVCIITHNEESNIRRCLEAVKWAEEIVVLDSGSTDATIDICREFTDKVHQRPFPGHIQQKNNAIDLAGNEWVLCVDADECVTPELAREMQDELSANGDAYAGYYLPRRTRFMGRWINHCGWYPDYKLRLFRKGLGRWGGTNPHDRVTLSQGATKNLRGDLQHFTYDDISGQMTTIDRFTTIFAEQMQEQGTVFGLSSMVLRPVGRFFSMYFVKMGFLDGMPGFVICVMGSLYSFLKYAKCIEMQNARDQNY
ncbi:MAG: glycosyltransferase family 2 protein [Planctomycetota bacterium]|jgi:glycosyltransferase involved in cell wall biosynthesis